MRKLCIAAVLSAGIAIFSCGVAGCGEEGPLMTASGQVSQVDWVGSQVTIMAEQEMTFVVVPDTKIVRGTEETGMSDIQLNDYIVVKYREGPSGDYRAVRISIQRAYPEF
jgi:hypothetical protein